MKNISTGTGIALLAGAIVAYPILDRVMPKADASATHTAAVIAAAMSQVEPTIVWYGTTAGSVSYGPQGVGYISPYLTRAWSDGTIEVKIMSIPGSCSGALTSCSWQVVSSANQGYSSASDINFDSKVDGADLGQLLTAWGDAPRHDVSPSDCPLNLINP